MKKFKSLMLAALASAALAAPSFADGHGGPNLGITGISGEVVYELQQSSTSPDEGNSTSVMDAEVGDMNISFKSDFYQFYFERDDEGSLDNRLKIVPSMKSGDNYVKAVGEIKGLFGDAGSDAGPYGDVFVEGGNQSVYVKVGTFGSTEYYGNGMGVSRASLGNGVDPDGVFKNGEHLVISGFKGIEVGVNAGDIKFEVALPWMNSGDSAENLLMNDLAGNVPTPFLILFGAGVVMIITLWLSKKAKKVTLTEIKLSSQNVKNERFKSNIFSNTIVRLFTIVFTAFNKLLPEKTKIWINNRFEIPAWLDKPEAPAYDLLRASVNLSVASMVIAYATNNKLPLSTTYVTFMVAMGTSLADRAWKKDTAGARVAGVINVISGWFLTALVAFFVAGLFVLTLYYLSIGGLFLILTLVSFSVYKTFRISKKQNFGD